MKLRKLIVKLIKIYIKEGNLDVTTCWPYDGKSRFYDLDNIDIVRNDDPTTNRLGHRIINLE